MSQTELLYQLREHLRMTESRIAALNYDYSTGDQSVLLYSAGALSVLQSQYGLLNDLIKQIEQEGLQS